MLQLKQITKQYPAGDGCVDALRGIDLQFRKSEFVSILGPSGCGKTTMLNIIGGLDHYTEGDLIINGKSTKDFGDRDWDAYRNHSVGFIFQSYNLIPHQSVLQNVELALSLSGVGKTERRRRAIAALEEVGLGSQINKRPGEMSGGQMQRVAIARAIVNNPDIILADEPTCALDSETSLQVMEILKEIARDRLVIMVTHNPDLAEQYSTRIVRMLDGVITSDSAPLSAEEIQAETALEHKAAAETGKRKKSRPSLSPITSFGLSLKNLFTKKGRTALTSFAGSIGIIGIALIYAVSQGMTTYIDTVQEDTLSSYPITLEAQHMDLGSLMQTFMDAAESKAEHENDAVYQKPVVYDMLNAVNSLETKENDLASFKKYIERKRGEEGSLLNHAVSGVQYTYGIDLQIFTKNTDGNVIRSDLQQMMRDLMIKHMGRNLAQNEGSGTSNNGGMMSMLSTTGTSMGLWQELLPGDNGNPVNPLLEKQYDVVWGTWPTQYNEIVLVLDSNNELDDITLYALGLIPESDIDRIAEAAVSGEHLDAGNRSWSYEEICGLEFRAVLYADCYTLDEASGLYTDMRETAAGMRYLYDNGTPLKVSGIIRPSEDAVSSMITGSIGYTNLLTKYVIERADASAAVKAQKEDPHTDIFTGLPFQENSGSLSVEEKAAAFREHIENLNTAARGALYVRIMSIPAEEYVNAMVEKTMKMMNRETMEKTMTDALSVQMGMSRNELESYITEMSDEDISAFFSQMIAEQTRAHYAQQKAAELALKSAEELAGALETALPTYSDEQCSDYYEKTLTFSGSSYKQNLRKMGCVDLENPATINLFASSFAEKDVIEEAIAEYNADKDELEQITYTDYIGLMMSSITTIINAITYVLIAFVAVSLVVSSIMIGVITLISVQERTKEIGILRAIGASKANVSGMFNAETVIIGFTSGLLGVLITYLLCIPINLILHHLTGINNLSAYLPIPTAVALVCISVLLTLISGIIPSRSAAKKDPVVALRTE
ncbi:MAG: ABC transporter ATP-binding protein/permease [Clostridia bacterium]|nr:ABC transporter ATP-binding protein/permease [Clostridia bacterium]